MFTAYMRSDHFTESTADFKTEKAAIEYLEFIADDIVWTANEDFKIVWDNEEHKSFSVVTFNDDSENVRFRCWIEEEENEEDD